MSVDTTGESLGTGEGESDATVFGGFQGRRAALGAAGTLAFLVVWQVASLAYPIYLLPSPVEVALAVVGQLTTSAVLTIPLTTVDLTLPKLLVKLLESLMHYVPGLLVGGVLGIAVGVAMGWSETLDAAFTPITRILRPIPPLAWIAFAIIWIGINHQGAAFIVAIGAFWINFYNAYAGVEGVPAELREVAASLGIHDDLTMIRKVVLPSASPEIFTGIRTSIGQCWMIVVAAELFGAPGVGKQIIVAAQNLALDVSVAYMLVISAVFLVSDGVFRKIQSEVLAWRS
ncbi:ABC transporter permease [Halospeciosus flavus]|uniref:ABC transporter permease n=1 Tax=Halospeciosus flavus TaxID=3032283 RepID=A0ABD5Z4M0_9EURY|nr:ABC transporter permease [Halospeciosus flavus]